MLSALPAIRRRPRVAARALARGGAAVRDWLPRGDLLSEHEWRRRHRLITAFALAQAVGLAVFALAYGRGPVAALLALAASAVPALVGAAPRLRRRARTLAAVTSLMFASTSLMCLTHAMLEMQFHVFVMLGIVALYQDWSAFGLCLGLSFAYHAVVGVTAPDVTFNGVGDLRNQHAMLWAVVDAAFILAASLTHMLAWRLNEHHESHDAITGLANRRAFMHHLARQLAERDRPVSVVFVDLDDFKTVNDAHGHRVGDIALHRSARRIRDIVAGRGLVARISGDEFAITQPTRSDHALPLARRIVAALGEPIVVDGHEVLMTVSAGVAGTELTTSRGAEDLVRNTDIAMHLAKSSGKNRVICYSPEIETEVRDRAELRQDLRAALALDQFEVFYQPTFVVTDGIPRLLGVEALLRWHHPRRGLVSPAEFIALAEESDDIIPIGAWVLRSAARQVSEWNRELPGCERLELAVNLSARQLRDPELLTFVSAALHASGLATDRLILEVTETMLLSDLDRARRQLDVLRRMGARVAIDDFGTGYSSLSYLARLPADIVKIDQSFVRAMCEDTRSVALVRSIVDLAAALRLEVVAEGIERPRQQRILSELGCRRSQGFLYSRPLPAEQFARFVTAAGAGADGAGAEPAGTGFATVGDSPELVGN